jgi:hypothetical protein
MKAIVGVRCMIGMRGIGCCTGRLTYEVVGNVGSSGNTAKVHGVVGAGAGGSGKRSMGGQSQSGEKRKDLHV